MSNKMVNHYFIKIMQLFIKFSHLFSYQYYIIPWQRSKKKKQATSNRYRQLTYM